MREVAIFVEDFGHAAVLKALLMRLSDGFCVPISVREYSVSGGHGNVERQFRRFVHDVNQAVIPIPDLAVVATDANCQGYQERLKRMREQAQGLDDRIVYCIPDPHVERWLLLDPTGFKRVLGCSCSAPDQKCDRHRYKRFLAEAVTAAGQIPLLGGLEYAHDIVLQMNLKRAAKMDDSFGRLLGALESSFRQWKESSNP